MSLEPYLDRPFALPGHCLGGSIAYELALWLERRGHRPSSVVLIASHVPHSPVSRVLRDVLRSTAFTAADVPALFGVLGGTAPDLLCAPELFAELLPAVSYYFELALHYQRTQRDRVKAPLWVYSGDGDGIVPPSLATEWAHYTKGPFSSRVLPGAGHFLTQTHGPADESS